MKYIKTGLIIFSLICFSASADCGFIQLKGTDSEVNLQIHSSKETAAKANIMSASKTKSFKGINFNPLRGTVNGIATMHGAGNDPQMRLLQERANEREDYVNQQMNRKKETENMNEIKDEKEKKHKWDFLLW